MRKLLSVIVVMFLVTGCVKNDRSMDAETVVTVKPVELFTGDTAKFKSFLGTMSGAFKLRYKGEKPNASLDLEVWQKGNAVEPAGSIGDLFFHSDGKENDEVEVIIAIEDDAVGKQMRIKLGTVYGSGSSVGTFTIPMETTKMIRGLLYDRETRSFTVEGDAVIPVWAMYGTSSNEIRASDLSLDALKEQEWALVVLFRSNDRP